MNTCMECKWWEFSQDLTFYLEFLNEGRWGFCHRNAPKTEIGFVKTRENEFCGEQEKEK